MKKNIIIIILTFSFSLSYSQDTKTLKNYFDISFGKGQFIENKFKPRTTSYKLGYGHFINKRVDIGVNFGLTEYEIGTDFLLLEKNLGFVFNYYFLQFSKINIGLGTGISIFYTRSNVKMPYPSDMGFKIIEWNYGYQADLMFEYLLSRKITSFINFGFTDKLNKKDIMPGVYFSEANRFEIFFGGKIKF